MVENNKKSDTSSRTTFGAKAKMYLPICIIIAVTFFLVDFDSELTGSFSATTTVRKKTNGDDKTATSTTPAAIVQTKQYEDVPSVLDGEAAQQQVSSPPVQEEEQQQQQQQNQEEEEQQADENENERKDHPTIIVQEEQEQNQQQQQQEEEKDGEVTFDSACADVCTVRQKGRIDKFGGDLLDPSFVLKRGLEAIESSIATLRANDRYGQYFDEAFIDPETKKFREFMMDVEGRKTVEEGDNDNNDNDNNDDNSNARDKLKRKVKVKILKMMNNIRLSERNINGCDCIQKRGTLVVTAEGSSSSSSGGGGDDDSGEAGPDFYERYVYANGGHSAAAGHGNLFNETSIAYLTTDLKPIWEAIGIEFHGRNYAMGGHGSSKFGHCSKEVFGTDVDFLIWDYAMIDNKDRLKQVHYAYRGAFSPGRPVLLHFGGHQDKMITLSKEVGITSFQHDGKVHGESMATFPDMEPDGIPLLPSEAEKIPRYARYMKCNGQSCKQDKWGSCSQVWSRTGWHSGYKAHAMLGHQSAVYFMDIIKESLLEIAESNKDTELLLEELENEERLAFEAMASAPVPDYIKTALKDWDEEDITQFMKGSSICRTAELPSQTRYLGYATNSNKTGGPAIYGEETYDTGIPVLRGLDKSGTMVVYNFTNATEPPPAGQFSLVYDLPAHTTHTVCGNHLTMPDYVDWYYAPLKDGKVSVTFPNEKEKAAYGYSREKFKGLLGIVLPVWTENKGKAKKQDLNKDNFLDGRISVTVNSKPVTGFKHYEGSTIVFFKGEGDNLHWEPSDNDDYTIEFTISDEKLALKNFRLDGLILY